MPGAVVRNVVGKGLRAARQRDGGDGVTRDETAWTWWTLPPAIAGCLAQRYRKCIPVSSHSCWTSRNMRSPGLGRGRQRLVVASGCQEREIRPCSSSMTAPRCRCDCVFPPTRVAPRSGFVLAGRACSRLSGLVVGDGWPPARPDGSFCASYRGMFGLGLAQLWRRAGRHPRRVFTSCE